MQSVVIFGAGELGGALARQLAAAEIVKRVVLVDEMGQLAEGKALDINQAAPIDRYSTLVVGTSDESISVGADAIVLADRASAANPEWQGDAGVALIRRLAELNATAMLLCAGVHHLQVIERGVREMGIPRHRVIGSAPEALRAAVISMTALEAGCVPNEISLTVVGRPPGHIIVPWDEASIGGRRATDVLSPPAISRLDARLVRLWPPGPLTLACAATRVLTTAAKHKREAMSALVALSPDGGGRGRVGMLPVVVSLTGVAHVLSPTLSARDRVRLDTALHR